VIEPNPEIVSVAPQPSPPSPSPRGATWTLRVMAAVLTATGVVPLANYLTMAQGLRWWAPAVRHWIVWAIVIGGAALLLARLLPRTYEELSSRTARLLLRPSSRTFALLVAALTCGLAIYFSWRLFRFQAATIDELSQQWQATMLANGRLFARAEPEGDFFSTMQTVVVHGRWFSHFPIGGPAIQAIGILLGVPWLINPLLAGVGAVAVYRFAAATSSEIEARGAALLFALSPFVLFIAGSKLDHVATLAGVWTAIAALPHWVAATNDRQARRAAAVIGAAMGIAATIRPYDAAIVGVVLGAFQLHAARGNRVLARSLVVQVGVGLVPVMLLLAANRATTGGYFTFGYDVLNGPDHRPGFHMSPLGFEHTPRHGIYTISTYLMRVNTTLLAWPVPVVAVMAVALGWQRRASRWDQLLIGLLAGALIGYTLYWGEGSFHGPRFLYTVAPVFLIYIARMPVVLRERVHGPVLRTAVTLLLPLWLLVAWLSPASTFQPFGVWSLAGRAEQRETVSARIADEVARQHLTNAVVFISDGWHARLTARLRALGVRPFMAQLIVGHYDACGLQQRLDDADSEPALATHDARTAHVFAILQGPPSRPVPGLSGMEQLALEPGQQLTESCREEWRRSRGLGGDLARMLPLQELDGSGRLAGSVVYARDYGARNERLRARFGNRAWYVARATKEPGDSLRVTVEPYAPAALTSRVR
jgi:hypothetical protein